MPIQYEGNDVTRMEFEGNDVTDVFLPEAGDPTPFMADGDSDALKAGTSPFVPTGNLSGLVVGGGSFSLAAGANFTADSFSPATYAGNAGTAGTADDFLVTSSSSGNVGTPGPDTCSPSGTANNQVFAGHAYTWNGSGTITTTYTNTVVSSTYGYTSTAPTTTSTQNRTTTVTYTIPLEFTDGGTQTTVELNADQPGSTGAAAPTSANSPCGVVSSGVNKTCNTSNTPNPNTVQNTTCSSPQTGTGTYSFAISGETAPTTGDTDTYSIGSVATTFSGGADTNYNWTVTGGTINSGQGTTSISVTWNTVGAGSVAASNSFAGAEGSTFSASDSHAVTVASASICAGLAAPTATGPTVCTVLGSATPNDGCMYDISTTTGFVSTSGFVFPTTFDPCLANDSSSFTYYTAAGSGNANICDGSVPANGTAGSITLTFTC